MAGEQLTRTQVAVDIVVVLLDVLVAAICSGLNIGLLSIEPLRLETIEKCGEPSERRAALKVRRLMQDRHLLLCSLLLFNALCMEVLPIVLDQLVGENLAVLLSVTALVLFGEIIPQAVCNKYGLQVGSFVAPLLWFMVFTTFAATYPLARFLDWLLGTQQMRFYKRQELAEIVEMHQEHDDTTPSANGGSSESASMLDPEEVKQITGAIKAASITVSQKEVLTPIADVTMLSIDAVFDEEMIDFIYRCGHSRIPIYEGSHQNIIGVIHVKQLMLYKPSNKQRLEKAALRSNLLFFDKNTRVFDALNQFQTGKSHLGVVRDENTVYGIVTLEDLIELILQSEIFDEDDFKESVATGYDNMNIATNAVGRATSEIV